MCLKLYFFPNDPQNKLMNKTLIHAPNGHLYIDSSLDIYKTLIEYNETKEKIVCMITS